MAGPRVAGHLTAAGWAAEIGEDFGEVAPEASDDRRVAIAESVCTGCGRVFLALNGRQRCICCRYGKEAAREGSGFDEDDATPAEPERPSAPGGRREEPMPAPLSVDREALAADIRARLPREEIAEKYRITIGQALKFANNNGLSRPPRRGEVSREKPAPAGRPVVPLPRPPAPAQPETGGDAVVALTVESADDALMDEVESPAVEGLDVGVRDGVPGSYPPAPAHDPVDLDAVRRRIVEKIHEADRRYQRLNEDLAAVDRVIALAGEGS